MEDLYIPKLIIQPVVENAIIHGISESVENGFLSIQLFTFKDDVLIKVYNTGPLFSHQVIEKIHSVFTNFFFRPEKHWAYKYSDAATVPIRKFLWTAS